MRASNLQTCNNEIVKALELAYERREHLQKDCNEHESKCQELHSLIQQLQEDLTLAQNALSKSLDKKAKYDKLIKETEMAYSTLVDSSQTLLDIVHQETQSLDE
ncbi:Sjoegren syndrome nuclear autoantigen 1 [Batrachochytrium dendrobatidis]